MAMGQMISPGVYTRIIDLSEYLADVPGTVAFCPIISRKGPDNKLTYVTSRSEFLNRFGEPNIVDYGKAFGQGPYVVSNHMSVASSMYVLRCLPGDATYSHCILGLQEVVDTFSTTVSSSSLNTPMRHLEIYPLHMDGQWHLTNAAAAVGYTLPDDTTEDDPSKIYYHADGTLHETQTPLTFGNVVADRKVAATWDGYNETPGWGWAVKQPTINDVKELDTLIKLYSTDCTDSGAGTTSDLMYPSLTGGTGIDDGILCYFRGLGRGDAYNEYSIRITKSANHQMFGVYILDIFETQNDGDDMIIESFHVSWDPFLVDESGESLFIEDVVNRFSKDIRCKVNRKALDAIYKSYEIDGIPIESYILSFYKNDPTLPEPYKTSYEVLDINGQKTDLGYKATMIELAKADYEYFSARLTNALADLSTARLLPTATMNQIQTRNEAIRAAIADVTSSRVYLSTAKKNLENAYMLDMLVLGDSNDTTAAWDPVRLRGGSEGSLSYLDRDTGKRLVDSNTATMILAQAYSGLLTKPDINLRDDVKNKTQYVDEVLDLDWIYFSLVYEAGYPPDVKDAARELCDSLRRDCMLISDITDLVDLEDTIAYVGGNPGDESGSDIHVWTTKYAARYSSYSRVYDKFTGRDMWVTPVYHMAQIIPMNDMLYEVWYAPAGLNRATIDEIKELRWNPKLGERDALYLQQVNPIVRSSAGYAVMGQLTTQKRPTALQDVNCMRLVLYIKRALEQYLKYFIFEFNDEVTWTAIKEGIIPFLERIKARRGLKAYSVDVGADEYEFKQKICHVNVHLTPMKVIEKIELNLFIH